MGVDTKLYISNRWSTQDIRDVITLRYGVPTEIGFHDFAPDYFTIEFKLPGAMMGRVLNVHRNSEVGGLSATQMSFRSNEEGHDVLKTLAKTFGGLFQEYDTSDDFVEFQSPDSGDMDFIVKEALKSNPKLGRDVKLMEKFLSDRGWEKPYKPNSER